MAIIDLTGCTWVAGDNIDLSPFLSNSAEYAINFISNATNYTVIELQKYTIRPTEDNNICYDNNCVYSEWDCVWTNEAYKTIEITGGTDATNATLISWFEANGTLTSPANQYSLTHTLSNITKANNTTFTLQADNNCALPSTITVTNGTLISYNRTTGIAIVQGDDTTSIQVECLDLYQITTIITNGTYSGDTQIIEGESATITITPNTNYELPQTITINGVSGTSGSTDVTWTYNTTSGVITLNNPTSNITISATCEQSMSQLNAPTIEIEEV